MVNNIRAPEEAGTLSGLTEREAQEFNKLFITSFIVFTAIAIVAHFLVWLWRPWLQTPEPVANAASMLQTAVSMLS